MSSRIRLNILASVEAGGQIPLPGVGGDEHDRFLHVSGLRVTCKAAATAAPKEIPVTKTSTLPSVLRRISSTVLWLKEPPFLRIADHRPGLRNNEPISRTGNWKGLATGERALATTGEKRPWNKGDHP